MHWTGQTSTQALSFTSMHASVMIARPAKGTSPPTSQVREATRARAATRSPEYGLIAVAKAGRAERPDHPLGTILRGMLAASVGSIRMPNASHRSGAQRRRLLPLVNEAPVE